MGEETLLQVSCKWKFKMNKKTQYRDGILSVTNDRMYFQRLYDNEPLLTLPWGDVKSMAPGVKGSGEEVSYLLKVDVLGETVEEWKRMVRLEQCRRAGSLLFVFVSLDERDAILDLSQPLLHVSSTVRSTDIQVLRQRATILAAYPEVQRLYEELVGGGVISEDEFWSTRGDLLADETHRTASQQQSLPSSSLADVRPIMGLSNAVKYKLTPAVIRQIFMEYPAVEKAYNASVPMHQSEVEFWTNYFKSQYFHKDQKGQDGRDNQVVGVAINPDEDIFSNAEVEDLQVVSAAGYGKGVKRLRRGEDLRRFDLEKAIHRGELDTEEESTGKRRKVVNAKELALIRRVNRHGTIVLGPERSETSEDSDEDQLVELEPTPTLDYIVLEDDVKARCQTHREEDVAVKQQVSRQQVTAMHSKLRQWREKMEGGTVVSEAQLILCADKVNEVEKKEEERIMRNRLNVAGIRLEDLEKEAFKRYFDIAQELLRHYHHDRGDESLHGRVQEKMNSLYVEIENYISQLGDNDKNKASLLLPVLKSLNKVLS